MGRPDQCTFSAVGSTTRPTAAPNELLALLQRPLVPRGLTAAFGGRIVLVDGLIHHPDIRRALGRPRRIRTERLKIALDFAPIAPPIGACRRIRGLRPAAWSVQVAG